MANDPISGGGGGIGPDASVAGVSAKLSLSLDDTQILRQLAQFEQQFATRMRSLSETAARELGQTLSLDKFSGSLTQLAADRQKQITDLRASIALINSQQNTLKGVGAEQAKINAGLQQQYALQQKLISQAKSASTTGAGGGAAFDPNIQTKINQDLAALEAARNRIVAIINDPALVQGASNGLLTKFQDNRTPILGGKLISDTDTQRLILQKNQLEALKNSLEDVRKAQDVLRKSFANGTGTKEEAAAFGTLQQKANTLESRIKSLSTSVQQYEAKSKQSISGVVRSFLQLDNAADKAQKSVNKIGGSLTGSVFKGSFLGNIAANAVQTGLRDVLGLLESLGERAIAFTAKLETASARIRQFTKDGAEAQTLTQQIVRLSLNSPFSLDTLVDATGRLLAMGTATSEVVGRVQTLSAAVAAVGGGQQIFNRVVLAISQIGAKAKLSAQDMRQLAEAGLPVFKILQEQLGLTSTQVQNIGRAGIDSAKGLNAILKGLDQRFGAGLILQLDTLKGASTNANTAFDVLLGSVAGPAAQQFKQFFQQTAIFLQDPGNIQAAKALGDAVGEVAQNFREWIFADTSGFTTFIKEIPTFISDIETEIVKAQNLLANFNPNLEGKPIFGDAEALNRGITELQQKVKAEAEKAAASGALDTKLNLDLIANLGKIQVDVSKAQLKVTGDPTKIDLSGFADALDSQAEDALAQGLSAGALKALNTMMDEVSKKASAGGDTGREWAHIGQQLRDEFLTEVSKLGDNPSVEQVQQAVNNLGSKLSIKGIFPLTDEDSGLVKLTQDTLELAVQQDNQQQIQAKLADQQTKATALSHEEQNTIDAKTASIKKLTDARKDESEANKNAIQDLHDQLDLAQAAKDAGDKTFDTQTKSEEANVKRLHTLLDPIVEGFKVADDAAKAEVERLQAHQQAVADKFAATITSQNRVIQNLGDSRSVIEAEFKVKIDAATDAEKAQQRVIKDANLDLREKLRVQDDIVSGVEDEYRGQQQIANLEVDKQNRSLRAAQRTFDKQDLTFAQQILDARKRGDTEAVKSLTEQRQQASINFQESQDAARAQLTVAQDNAQAIQDTVDAQTAQAKGDKAAIQEAGQRNIDNLTKQGEVLSDNTQKVKDDSDAALGAYDSKIRIAKLFLEVLQRTSTDVDTLNKADVTSAQAKEKAAADALDKQKTAADALFKQRDDVLAAIKEQQTAFDGQQQDILDGLNGQLGALQKKEDAAQRASDATIKPLQAEVEKLNEQHKTNDILRQDEIDKTKNLQTESTTRIGILNAEIAKLNELQTLRDNVSASDKAVTAETSTAAGGPSGGVQATDTNSVIQDLIDKQPVIMKDILVREIAKARADFAISNNIHAFDDIAAKIFTLAIQGGLSSQVDKQSLSAFLNPQTQQAKQPVGVDPRVLEFFSALDNGQVKTALDVLKDPNFVRLLERAVVGTDTQPGSFAVQQKLGEALPRLALTLPKDVADALTAALAEAGITNEKGTSNLNVPTFTDFQATSFTSAADIQLEAAKLQKEAALARTGVNTPGDTLNILKKALDSGGLLDNNGLLGLGSRIPGQVRQSDLEAVLTGQAGVLGNLNEDRVLLAQSIAAILADQTKSAALLAAIKANPDEFKQLFDKLFPNGQNNPFTDTVPKQIGPFHIPAETTFQIPQSAFDKLKKALDDALGGVGADAKTQGANIPAKLGDGIDSGAKGVADSTQGSIVDPINTALGTLPDGAKTVGSDTSSALIGGLQDINSGDNVKTVAGLTSDLSSSLYTPLVDGGALAGKDTVSAIVGKDGLAGINDSAVLKAIGASMGGPVTAILQALRDGLVTQDAQAGTSPLSAIGASAAGQLVEGFTAAMAAQQAAIAAVEKTTFQQAGTDALQGLAGLLPGVGAINAALNGQGGTGFQFPIVGGGTPIAPITQGFRPGAGNLEPNHTGIDIAAPQGTAIHAAAAGTVVKVGHLGTKSYGNYCIIEHVGGFSTLYGHMMDGSPTVSEGQEVTKGQTIGFVGSTGFSTGFHLHFETRHNGAFVDPRTLLPAQGGGDGSGTIPTDTGSPVADATTLANLSGSDIPKTKREAIQQIVLAMADIIKESGGDLNTVIDAVLSGAQSLSEGKLKGFTAFAQTQMKTAFSTLLAAIEALGGGGLDQLKAVLQQTGLLNPVTSKLDKAAKKLREDHPSFSILEALGNVEDRSALTSLANFLNVHQDDPVFSRLFGLLQSVDKNTPLTDVIAQFKGSFNTPPQDTEFIKFNTILDRLSTVLPLITAGDAQTLGRENPATIRQQELLNLLAQSTNGSGFQAALVELLKNGRNPDQLNETLTQLAKEFKPNDAAGRRLLGYLLEQFGGQITALQLRDIATTVGANGQRVLKTPAFTTAPVQHDPAAEQAAALIRQFALANQFLTDDAGKKIEDKALTNLLAALRNSQASTLDQFLQQSDVANIGSDDSPLGKMVALLRNIQAQNPNVSLADLKGFLFGGDGFTSKDVVSATDDVRSAVDTTNAILLGATDAESIQIWKDLLHVWTETAPALVDNTAATADAAQAAADASATTADNTATLPDIAGSTADTAANTDPTNQPPPVPFVVPDDAFGKIAGGLQGLFGGQFGQGALASFPELIKSGQFLPFQIGKDGVLFGLPESQLPDIGSLIQGGPAGSGTGVGNPNTAAQEFVDAISKTAKPDGTFLGDPLTQSKNVIIDEIKARRALVDLLNGKGQPIPPPAGTGNGTGTGTGTGTGGAGGGGGSGAHVEGVGNGSTTVNIFQANDPFFTASVVTARLNQERRRWGG